MEGLENWIFKMLEKNPVKEKLATGRTVFGCFEIVPSPTLVEFLGTIGFDFVVMDAEHRPLSYSSLDHIARAAETAGIPLLVRVSRNDEHEIGQALNCGVMGIQVPHVITAMDARKAIDSILLPPQGRRNASIWRESSYGAFRDAKYWTDLNARLLTIVQIEDVEAIDNLPAIIAVEGIDVLAIGLSDLSTSLGFPGDFLAPSVQEATKHIIRTVVDAGKTVSISPPDLSPDSTAFYVNQGVRMIKYADLHILKDACINLLESMRKVINF